MNQQVTSNERVSNMEWINMSMLERLALVWVGNNKELYIKARQALMAVGVEQEDEWDDDDYQLSMDTLGGFVWQNSLSRDICFDISEEAWGWVNPEGCHSLATPILRIRGEVVDA